MLMFFFASQNYFLILILIINNQHIASAHQHISISKSAHQKIIKLSNRKKMLKFIKHHMTSIGNIEIYPIISLLLFVTIFVAACWMAMRASKAHIAEMSNTPLED
jgi:cytochrome c oxidase cbb3-type subunit 4